ncbi:DUF262 domain-containing protein [Aerosakkonema funiforme]|uniref:DUF262 domain-containing protein n=1 Tax=Aerosakkonema funiforme TaxID=1246630 RepID=UPI0035B86225
MTDLKNQNPELFERDNDIEDNTWVEAEEEDIKPEEEEIITEPFDPTQIRVETRPMSIDLVLSRIQYKELDLTPDFQRHAGIWTDVAKSRLIESILIRIPLPAFYMDATDEDKWLVIDGLQRLTALKKFILDKELRLKGLEFLRQLSDKTYDELPRNYQRRINETVIAVYLIEKGTPPEVKFNIFKRINTGGLPLSLQEIRHALNQGKAAKLLARLAESTEFKQATGLKNSRKYLRMEDRNFVLRFLAFTLTPYNQYQAKSLDLFLNETMSNINKMSDQQIKKMEDNFLETMKIAFDIFGKYAFRKRSKEKPTQKNPINKALFEAWSVNLSNLSNQQIQILKDRKDRLIDTFVNLMESDENFMGSISQGTDSVAKVKYRFSKIEKLIQEVLA